MEDLKIEMVSEYSIGKSKKHSDKVGSMSIDHHLIGAEALEELLDVIKYRVFENDPVKLNVTFTTSNC